MKGVSDIIAMLLMLIITIGLAGLAYSYITGVFTARTAVVLVIDSVECAGNGGNITVFVRNDGSSKSGQVTVSVSGDCATSVTCAPIASISAGGIGSTSCSRTGGTTGYCSVRASTSGATSQPGSVYCPS